MNETSTASRDKWDELVELACKYFNGPYSPPDTREELGQRFRDTLVASTHRRVK